jgi:hypothetical protein
MVRVLVGGGFAASISSTGRLGLSGSGVLSLSPDMETLCERCDMVRDEGNGLVCGCGEFADMLRFILCIPCVEAPQGICEVGNSMNNLALHRGVLI